MKHHPTIPALSLVFGMIALGAGTSAQSHRIEPEDYFTLAGITGVAVAPDGATAAWTEMRWDPPAEGRRTDLWVVDLETRETRRLTFGAGGASGIRFSGDGQWIHYGANDEAGHAQVWRIAPGGGAAQAVTRVAEGIDLWDVAGGDRMLAFTVGVEKTEDEWKDLRKTFAGLEYGDGITTYSEVRLLDMRTWRTRTLSKAERVVLDLDLSPNGETVALVTTPDNELVHREGWSAVEVLDVASGETTFVTQDGWRDRHPSPFGWVDSVRMADDGRALAFTVSFDGYPTLLYVAERDGAGWRLDQLVRPEGVSVTGGTIGWKPGGRDLVFVGDVRARAHLYTVPGVRAGAGRAPARALTRGDATVGGWAYGGKGDPLVVTSGSLTRPDDLFLMGEDGALDRLTDVNPQVADWILPSIEVVQWTAPDGRRVEGILEKPPGWTPEDGPLPLIVEIHGGPTAATYYRLRFWIYGRTLLPAKGYALLSPNYRGSTGYGDDFLTELVGRENDIDVADILSGVDAMIERGIADPARLGVMGWSNGGFLTNALISATNRFQAASSGAGVVDQVLQWATEDTPGHVVNFMSSALPWQDPKHYVRSSPLYGLGDVTTPTLIHVGANDPRVPPAHARALFRALSIYLDVPCELLVYPGAFHSLSTYTHRKAKMAWDLAWFEKYVGKGWAPAKKGG